MAESAETRGAEPEASTGALKVQLDEVAKRGEGVWLLRPDCAYVDQDRIFGGLNRLLKKLLE